MNLDRYFLSQQLWRAARIAPPSHWARASKPILRSEQRTFLLMFALASIALISGVLMSVLIVYRATDRIARDHENAMFDLLAVTPAGGFGASWARFTAFIHYGLTLPLLNRMRWLALSLIFLTGVFTLLTLYVPALETGNPQAVAEAWSWLLFYVFLLPMMVFDTRYAVVSGGLLSILVPTYNSGDARVTVIFAGITLHLTGYLLAALTGALILPTIYQTMGVMGWLADLSRPVMALTLFVLLHESAVLLLFRAAQDRLNGEAVAQLNYHPAR
jgi:hypothetical protein